jgi:NADPH-dependent 2,4-dienoyl-CoA reductase/sulfur reductase-like enzyme
VAGIGIHPNLDLAKEAGLKVNNGVIVNEQLETSVPDVYAAGDVANFHHAMLGKRTRVEHGDNAVQMGETAVRNMAGATEGYSHAPMFYSDLFDLGYEAVGEMSSKMKTIADWQEQPFKKGVVYYMDDGRVRGVLLWNVWDKVNDARALMNEPSLVLAAEPTGNLDAKAARAIGDLLADVTADGRAILIAVTHSEPLAARFARRFRMSDGQLVDA